MRLTLCIISLLGLVSSEIVCAQTLSRPTIAIMGEGKAENNYYLNQTVGEAVSGTDKGNFHFLTQGYQQPSLINTKGPDIPTSLDAIDVYPNPVSSHTGDLLTVSFRIIELTHYYIDLYDVRGTRLLHNSYEDLTSQDIKLDFSKFGQGIYFVHVYSSNLKMDRHFKIEKF
ncbi:MAG: T9SS type A sorting domain-containing protein [Bacteroidales bacterium]|nr:T9SS type A sorting domain-containing protein [Bacteroidales bacterium]